MYQYVVLLLFEQLKVIIIYLKYKNNKTLTHKNYTRVGSSYRTTIVLNKKECYFETALTNETALQHDFQVHVDKTIKAPFNIALERLKT